MIRVRFAPTPTGLLFVSGARVALANYLFASRNGGRLLLRFDDLDTERCKPVHADQIVQDLQWLGIEWNECIRQSERLDLYQQAITRLKESGLLYPCFETEEELRAKQEFRRKRKQPQIYDRAMLALTLDQRTAAEAGGKRPHWRLRLSGRTLEWRDLVQGERHSALGAVSDPILVRADGSPTPLLASVVDDIATGTTHIIRGEDNAGNTAVQIELFEVLTGKPCRVRFGHLPPLTDGGRTSPGRRVSQLSLRGLRNDGVEAGAIAVCMAGCPSDDADPPSIEALAERFDLTEFAASHFDVGQILAANRRILQAASFADVAGRLPGGATETFWLAVRGSLDLLKEARGWWDVVAGTIVPPVVDGERDLLAAAEALLPPEPWDASIWGRWIAAIEQATGRAADAVLPALRLALTGEDSGPELGDLLPLMGRSRAADRLRIAAS
jgi:glutamyl-tRNA synthetase